MMLSLEQVMRDYQDSVFKAAVYILKDRYEAEDVVQETFLTYHSENKEFDSPEHIKAWLLRVAINKSKNIASSFWRKRRENIEDYVDTLMFEDSFDGDLIREVLKLPEKCRIAVHLFYYEDYSVREIADVLKVSESTVKSQLHRGRKLLEEKLRRFG